MFLKEMNGRVVMKTFVSWLLPTQGTLHGAALLFLPFPRYRAHVPRSCMCKWPNRECHKQLQRYLRWFLILHHRSWSWVFGFHIHSVLDPSFEFIHSQESRVSELFNDVNTCLLGTWGSSFGMGPSYYQYCYPSLYFLCSFFKGAVCKIILQTSIKDKEVC